MMRRSDSVLDSLKREMMEADREIDNAKRVLDSLGNKRSAISNQINSIKCQMDACINNLRRENDAKQACYRAKDHYYANVHKYNAENYRNELNRLKSIKQSYYNELNSFKGEWDRAVSKLRSAKDRKNRARKAFNARLESIRG